MNDQEARDYCKKVISDSFVDPFSDLRPYDYKEVWEVFKVRGGALIFGRGGEDRTDLQFAGKTFLSGFYTEGTKIVYREYIEVIPPEKITLPIAKKKPIPCKVPKRILKRLPEESIERFKKRYEKSRNKWQEAAYQKTNTKSETETVEKLEELEVIPKPLPEEKKKRRQRREKPVEEPVLYVRPKVDPNPTIRLTRKDLDIPDVPFTEKERAALEQEEFINDALDRIELSRANRGMKDLTLAHWYITVPIDKWVEDEIIKMWTQEGEEVYD